MVTTANATAARIDPYGTFQFAVDIGSKTSVMFGECSGLEMQVRYDEVREGGQNEYVHRLPSRVEYGNLVLRRGYAITNEFYNWCLTCLNRAGKPIDRRNVAVSLVNLQQNQIVFTWTFVGAYPVKWSGPSFRANESVMAIESLELAHQGIQVA